MIAVTTLDTGLISLILSGSGAAALVALFKARADRDLSISGAYSTLVGDLQGRIESLEEDLATERTRCDKQLALLQDRISDLEKTNRPLKGGT